MEPYNLLPETSNHYNTSTGDYDELIDIDPRQSVSNANERKAVPKHFPTTPTENRINPTFSKYPTANNISIPLDEQRQEIIRSHNPDISHLQRSPTKGSKTGITR